METNISKELKITEQFSFAGDDFKFLLSSLCAEIDKFGTDFLSTATLLTKIPYELAMLVVDNLSYRKKDYVGLINSLYYDEFFSDMKTREENKKSKFQNRYLLQNNTDLVKFAIERLLTKAEVEHIIELLIEDGKLDITLEDVLLDKNKNNDKKFRTLVKAHKYLSKKENAKVNADIINKMSKFWLEITLSDIRKKKNEKGLMV